MTLPANRTKTTSFRLEATMHRNLLKVAALLGIKPSVVIALSIGQFLAPYLLKERMEKRTEKKMFALFKQQITSSSDVADVADD